MLPICLLLAGAAPPVDPPWPPDAVVLVIAGWCAPCHREVAQIDDIAAAAGGRQVQVIGIDQSPGTRALLARVPAARRWLPSPVERNVLRDAVYAASAGLPYAVATDRRGRVCADARLGLDAARTRALVAQCPSPAASASATP